MNSKIFLLLSLTLSILLNYLYVTQNIFAYREVTIIDGNRINTLKTKLKSVKAILSESDISLNEYDIIYPTQNSQIGLDRKIEICRVNEMLHTDFIPLTKNIIRVRSSKLPLNKEIVLKEGSDGLLKRVKKIIKINNIIVKEEVIEEKVYRNKIDKMIIVGTNRNKTYIDKIKSNDSRLLHLRTTAYTPGSESCAPYDDGITSIGLRAGYGIAAVDPRIIPIGSSLYIPGYGYAIAADIGGLIKEHKLDLCFYSVRVAREYGVRYQDVYILNN